MKSKELFKNLDQYRPNHFKVPNPTKEQIEFLVKARKGESPITYSRMAGLWEEVGWGRVSSSTIQRLCARYVRN